jgi:thioredoxin reductase
LPNEHQLPGASLYYGAGLSEAPLCHNEHVVVIGGGNSAGQARDAFLIFSTVSLNSARNPLVA